TADPAGEAARERQRAIERALRHWRELEAAALTPEGARRARDRIAAWDAEMADHVAAHGLRRKRYREQIGAGVIPPAGVVARTARRAGVPTPQDVEH
ncbi:phage minor capsid protein, partial [Streptomyces sp. NPDC088341]